MLVLLTPTYWACVMLAAAAALVLTQLPLTNLLGYEFAWAMCGVVALLAGPVSVAWGRQYDVARGHASAPTTPMVPVALLLALPLAIIGVNAFFVRNCDALEGLAFYAVLPLPSALLAAATGAVCVRVLGLRRGRALAGYYLVLLSSLGLSAARLYRAPQVFAFDHFLGWFAGPLYDESMEIDRPLLWFRALTLAYTAVLVVLLGFGRKVRAEGLGAPRRSPIVRPAVLLVCAGAAAVLQVSSGRLGFGLDRADILAELDGVRETEHFVIHYPRRELGGSIDVIAADHEFRFHQVTEALEVMPEDRLHSYVYASAADKARLIGAGRTNLAKPWLGEIHIHQAEFPNPVLKHELVHVLAAPFGAWPFSVTQRGFLPQMTLIEGLAEAVAWDEPRLTGHQWAAALRRVGLAPDLRDLLDPAGFWGASSSRAYTLAGSFIRYLIEAYGPTTVKQAYAEADFQSAFGKDVGVLVTEWERFVDAMSLSDSELAQAEHRYRRAGMFRRVCAREVAQLRSRADRARDGGKLTQARRLFERCAGFEPDNPQHELDLAMLADSAGDDADFDAHAAKLLAMDATTRAQQADLREKQGDRAWRKGALAGAGASYRAVLAQSPDVGTTRALQVKLEALAKPPAVAELVRQYLVREGEGDIVISVLELRELLAADPSYATVAYLLGRRLFLEGHFAEADPYLAISRGALPSAELERENLRLLAVSAFRAGRFLDARVRFWDLVAESELEADRLEARDWIERCHWQAARSEPAR